ncbi:Uncharacterized [Syntrophomonas zehnderi OL-4]|uniref:Uncharacterized n=1 Tax=Syntrophomonas zehnderi OL-4 TaxID=690567 RepID=A0A0E4GC90_9FIRM|nr:hypothetical protein [Syntrophomonas zehnderi]CFY12584.1 Uncharacterized [Syntrophomonas zehnderi OL-4]
MQKAKRILALLLVAALTVTQLPVIALATSAGEGGEIIAFDTLPEETANQTVTLGTSLEDLSLPNTLYATVRVAAAPDTTTPEADNETVLDSGEPEPQQEPTDAVSGNVYHSVSSNSDPAADNSAPTKPTFTETITIPVKWVSSPYYDGEKAGTYTFTPQIEGFTVSAAPPSIAVTVSEITGTVTAFEELPDNIRWQNTAEPTFPEMVGGTVERKAVQIPVTWETKQDYDDNAPERGLYCV